MKRSRLAAVMFAVVVGAIGLGAAAAERSLIHPGVRIAGVAVGGRTLADARRLLAPSATAFAGKTITVIDGTGEWRATDADLGLVLDEDRALALAFAVGRRGDIGERLRDVTAAATRGHDIGWPRTTVDDRLDAFIAGIAADVDHAPVDAAVAIGPNGVELRAAEIGSRTQRAALREEILASTVETVAIALPTVPLRPDLDDEAVAEARQDVLAAYAPVRVIAGSESVTVGAPEIAATVRIVREAGDDGSDRLMAALDRGAVDLLAQEVATALDGPVRDAVLVPGGERLEVVAGRDGVEVDVNATAARLERVIFASAEEERVVEASATILHPNVTTAEARQVADELQLVGGFTTYFPESWARATNIGLAASRFDGMVVAPGASFSFWDRIGEVSPATGYVPAGAIIGGISQTAIGGGLCQVSTTLFNAVAIAGYRIDERHPHDYYIERYPLGLDASVFAPLLDLRWTNDTSAPAYIRAASTRTSVSFWIYTAATGRETIFTDPIERNLRWPAPGQPADPAHAPGYVVLGRDVWVTRIVLESGVERSRDVIFSHYAPVWGGPAQ